MAFRARFYLETKDKGVFEFEHRASAISFVTDGGSADACFIEINGEEHINRGNLLHLAARLGSKTLSRTVRAKRVSFVTLMLEVDLDGNTPYDLARSEKFIKFRGQGEGGEYYFWLMEKLVLQSNGLSLWTSQVEPINASKMLRRLALCGISIPQAAIDACNNMPCWLEIVRAGGVPPETGWTASELNQLQIMASQRNSAERILRRGMRRRQQYLPGGYHAEQAKKRFEGAQVTQLVAPAG